MMRPIPVRSLFTVSLIATLFASESDAAAQVIQLPIVHQFGVTTTVMVPDGGAAHMGGVRRGREGLVSRGNPLLPGRLGSNRAIGRDFSTADNWAVVRIIDLKELDRMTLLAASPDEIALLSDRAAEITKTVRKSNVTGAGASSLAELRAGRKASELAALAEPRKQLAKAEAFEKLGRLSSAKIYYRLAYRDGDAATRRRSYSALRRLSVGENANTPIPARVTAGEK
jgi:hypothetical protein